MHHFVQASACNGKRPVQISYLHTVVFRQMLVTKLMKERLVARFLIAPSGFGKTNIALQYAELIFSFKHVFWFDCENPCFLRDLDAGVLVRHVQEEDDCAALCVFDNLCFLDDARSAAFSSCIDALLAAGIEVLVCATPSRNLDLQFQKDRAVLNSQDFLLRKTEWEDSEFGQFRSNFCTHTSNQSCIPALYWEPREGALKVLQGFSEEEITTKDFIGSFASLVLLEGDTTALASLVFGEQGFYQQDLLQSYSFLGIDAHSFSSLFFDIELLHQALGQKVKEAVSRQAKLDYVTFIEALAEELLSKKNTCRACELVSYFLSEADQYAWLSRHVFALVYGDRSDLLTKFVPVNFHLENQEVTAYYRHQLSQDQQMSLLIYYLAALLECSGKEKLETEFKFSHFSTNPHITLELRIAACALLFCFAEDDSICFKAKSFLSDCRLLVIDNDRSETPYNVKAAWLQEELWWRPVSVLACLLEEGVCDCVKIWEQWIDGGMSSNVALLTALLLVKAYARKGEAISKQYSLWRFVDQQLKARDCKVLEVQFASCINLREKTTSLSQITYAYTEIPRLHIQLMGQLEVFLDDKPLKSEVLRKKPQLLLVLLALRLGKESSRDYLMESLWPEVDYERSRRNFYNLWATLKKALLLPDGTCPYLVKRHDNYFLDSRYVSSDIQDLTSYCKELQFGPIIPRKWTQLLDSLTGHFGGELVSFERENEELVSSRNRYNALVTDALATAAARLTDYGESQIAVWFAQEALVRDRVREDAYEALMKAQIATGQRTSALHTYFKCQEILTAELGIDPSSRTQRLYESILQED